MKSLRPHFVWTLGVKGPTPEKWCSYPLHEEQRASHLARVLAIYPISLEEWERATLSELAARYPKHNALKAGERESTAARPPTLRDRLDSSARLWNQSATMLWRVSSPRHYPAGFIEPCLPTVPSKPPSGPEWIHEINTTVTG